MDRRDYFVGIALKAMLEHNLKTLQNRSFKPTEIYAHRKVPK